MRNHGTRNGNIPNMYVQVYIYIIDVRIRSMHIKSNAPVKTDARDNACNIHKQVFNVICYVFAWYCVCILCMYVLSGKVHVTYTYGMFFQKN